MHRIRVSTVAMVLALAGSLAAGSAAASYISSTGSPGAASAQTGLTLGSNGDAAMETQGGKGGGGGWGDCRGGSGKGCGGHKPPKPCKHNCNKPKPPVVPIPAAVWLFGSGLLGMAGLGYRRRANRA